MMKVVDTIQEYWNIPKYERKNFCLGEELLAQYPIKDNGEPLINLMSFFKKNKRCLLYQPPREIAEIKQELLLRETAAKLLLSAAKKLPPGYKFLISEGYRPLWYQKQIFTEIFEEMKKKYPDRPEKEVWAETTLYVADPALTPPHSTGGTLDLTIVDANDDPIDMGNPLNSVDLKSNTFSEGLTNEQLSNRLLLFETLSEVGFVNLASEWWHYSYGDQYWAIYNEEPHAIYDKVDQ